MAHQHLSLQSLNGLQSNAHDNDDGSTTDGQAADTGNQLTANQGQQSNDCQINSTEHNDLVDDLADEVSGGLAGTEAGNKAAILLQLVLRYHPV